MPPPLLPGAVALSVLRMVVQVLEEQPQLLDHFAFLEDLPTPKGGSAVPWDVVDPVKRRKLALANLKQMVAARPPTGRPQGLALPPTERTAIGKNPNKRLPSAPAGDPTT